MKRYESYKPSGISWIGEIPSHWEKMRIKHTGIARNGLTYSPFDLCNKEDNGTLVLRSSNIQRGDICLEDCVYVKSTISPDLKVNAGDIIICSRNGSRDLVGKLALIPENLDASFGAFMLIYRRKEKYKSKYFVFMLPIAIQAYKALFTTSTINQLTQSEFANFQIPIPPLEEQKKIVEYLSTKTSLIDAQQSAREKEIRLLEELKQAEIANVVTRGLNPDVPKKDSGIPWVGQIPSHWNVKRLGAFFNNNISSNSEYKFDKAYKFNYGTIVPKNEIGDVSDLKETYLKYSILKKNDIIINGLNLNYDFVSQRVAISPADCIITSAYIVLRPVSNNYSLYFLQLFKAMDSQKLFHGMGTGIRLTLSFNELKSQMLPIPPIEEQRAIVEYIEQKNTVIDDMIANLRAEIDFLTEYKQRMIADAVTGQIKID